MALIAGLAMAVESTNIVGYVEASLIGNANNDVVSTFGKVGGNNAQLVLGDITVNEYATADNGDTIRIYSEGEEVLAACYFSRALLTALEQPETVAAGWWDNTVTDDLDFSDATRCYNSFPLPFGTGFTVSASSDDSKVIFAGEVQGEQEVTFIGNANNDTGNALPMTVTLGTIVANEYAGADNGDTIRIYSEGEEVLAACYFSRALLTALEQPETVAAGWWDNTVTDDLDFTDATRCYNSYTLTAGRGFTISASSDDSGLVFPNPLTLN